MNCLNCNKPISSEGTKPKLYCSDKCRKAYKRTKETDKPASGQEQTDKTLTPEGYKSQVPENYGQPDCTCKHCQQNRDKPHPLIINHGKFKLQNELQPYEINRTSLPGDVDYGK
jgi:hypothetical protein